MKFLIFTVLIVGTKAVLDEEFIQQTRARVKQVAEECIKEENATPADLETIMDMRIPESHEGKCLLFCAHKKFNFQNDDGSINNEGAMETFEVIRDMDADFHDKVVNAFNHCLTTPGDPDPCLYSAALSMCFLKKAKEEGIHELIME